jgi:benzoyl-CoA-dihydrodiol lyase
VRETIGLLRRTFSRLDVSSRSLFALIEPGSCFAGTLLELALACDRSYMLILPDDAGQGAQDAVSESQLRPATRWSPARAACSAASTTSKPRWRRARAIGQALDADAALALGLVTSNPDDIDWADEVRIAWRSARR